MSRQLKHDKLLTCVYLKSRLNLFPIVSYSQWLKLSKPSHPRFVDLTFSRSDPIDDEGKPTDSIRNITECGIILCRMAKETIFKQQQLQLDPGILISCG
jgi:hypothetical protein